MKDIIYKLKTIFLPFLLISVGCILFYNSFRYILDIQLNLLTLKKDVLNYWIPTFLPWVPVLLWLRRRTHLLKMDWRHGQGHFNLQILMAITMIAPLIISQNYLTTASYDLVHVQEASQIHSHSSEKYFKVDEVKLNSEKCIPYTTSRVRGKSNQHLVYHYFLSCPLENTEDVWVGIEHKKQISNNLSDKRKEEEYQDFLAEAESEVEAFDLNQVRYFEKVPHSDERDGFIGAIKRIYLYPQEKHQIILTPKTDDFSQRSGNTFLWIFTSFGIGAFLVLLVTLFCKLDVKEVYDFNNKKPLENDDLREVLIVLNPIGPYAVTANLIWLNLLVFLWMVLTGVNLMSPTVEELLAIGGNHRGYVLEGEYWRLIASMFVHSGLMHIGVNVFGLWLGGSLLEDILGRYRLLTCYIICGLLGSVSSILWYENTVSVGASGGVFGLFGMIFMFTLFRVYSREMRSFNWIFLAVYGLLSLLLGFLGSADNAAHMGGLLTGCALGGIFVFFKKRELKSRSENSGF